MIKKIFISIMAFSLIIISQTIKSESVGFELEILEESSSTIQGVDHYHFKALLHFEGETTNQNINILTFNPLEDQDLHLVVADSYHDHSYTGASLPAHAYDFQQKYFNQIEVVAGVNGDFYDTSQYFPVMAHIRDYEVIYDGLEGRSLIGFKENGEVVMGTPQFGGYEILVYDEDGSLKDIKIKVDGFNREPENNEEVIVYFDNYKENNESKLINNDNKKLVIAASNSKIVGNNHYFAKGNLQEIINNPIIVDKYNFVLTGEKLFKEGLITDTDIVVVQNTFLEPFNNVRYAIGGNQKLIIDGEVKQGFTGGADRVRRPRTAFGLKEDGTVILITVDGDQKHINIDGIYVDELSWILKYFGAYNAINLDGGGSTSMITYDEQYDGWQAVNKLSLGTFRLNSNSLLVVKGQFHEKLPPSPFPDTRSVLQTPNNIYITDDGKLFFDEVENALYYKILINNSLELTATKSPYQLDLNQRIHNIKIKAFGDFNFYKQSSYTKQLQYYQNTNAMLSVIEGLINYTKQIHEGNNGG